MYYSTGNNDCQDAKVVGIEPTSPELEAGVLPLHYTDLIIRLKLYALHELIYQDNVLLFD